MKLRTANLILSVVAILFILISCDTSSSKGKWSEDDKQSFRQDMESIGELSAFGDKKGDWIECYLIKCEANFSSYFEADNDLEGCRELALKCSEEIFSNGSVKGKWSDDDKQRFRKEMDDVDDMSVFGDKKDEWIDCYLSKCESRFSSFFDANSNVEGCEEIAMDCNDEVFN